MEWMKDEDLFSFERYIKLWSLEPDGVPVITHSSRLLPVRYEGKPAMLKIATEEHEQKGARVMIWWSGSLASARVLAHEGSTLLLERAVGTRSLAEMARKGQDDEATRIICAAAERLHNYKPALERPELLSLEEWFEPLLRAGPTRGGILEEAARIARLLLDTQEDLVVLHGDLHHENILDNGDRGWIAIDPKQLYGERCFDFANILRDPDPATATSPGRFDRQVQVITEAAAVKKERLLQWTLAFCCLSAVWYIEDGEDDDADFDLQIAALARAALMR